MLAWLKDTLGTAKPIIGMCHLHAFPGDPDYDQKGGLELVIQKGKNDLLALQEGGVDAVMFSNEFSLPYLTKTEPITTICMARVITELLRYLSIPFGVNVLWDPIATIDLAVSTGAHFAREIFTGVYASDFGLWNTNYGEVARHRKAIHGENVRLLFNIYPESAKYLAEREIAQIARSTVFNTKPDGICVSGLTAGIETPTQLLSVVKEAIPDTPVFANTGVNITNVTEQLAVADGAIVGTSFKKDCIVWNPVDPGSVRAFMEKVRVVRKGLS
ncbi:MAG TPA: BtpA/SgcQ family protein [Anaerolineales bacterium]|nr:BtpA/SgcQ family protein [Anaerolineales bacterium]